MNHGRHTTQNLLLTCKRFEIRNRAEPQNYVPILLLIETSRVDFTAIFPSTQSNLQLWHTLILTYLQKYDMPQKS